MNYLIAIYFVSALIVGTHILRSSFKNPFAYVGSSLKRAIVGMLFSVLCPIYNTLIVLELIWFSLIVKYGR